MTYAKVINGEIVENNRTLPFSNELTSFGVGSTPTDMMIHDYYPIVGTEPVYDTLTQRVNGVTYAVVGNEVVKTYNVVDLTNDEIRANTVPQVVTPRQARLALLQATLLDEVELLLVNDKAMQIWWEYSLDIKRDHPHIIAMGTALGMTEQQLDELFILAGSL